MKTAIWEYIIPSEREKENLWNNCTFVFDTNVRIRWVIGQNVCPAV